MARTPGSGWGAGNPTFQTCPSCGRKTLYFYGRVYPGDTGYRCTFSARGCGWENKLDLVQYKKLIPRRNFNESDIEALLIEFHG